MAKTLSNTSNLSAMASVLSGIATAAMRPFLPRLANDARSEAEFLPARLRHDLGELDLNPVLYRGHSLRGGSDLSREIMRRHF
ncbi:hypothetical protein [Aestuariivirga sp.]|uniref:hypothetical protein n=1 Tax=Aestuariivirga sp. TaxID=2650926 RepID=UPI003594235D